MSKLAFLLAVLAFGIGFTIWMHRLRDRFKDENPGKKNPIDYWLTGRYKNGDNDSEKNKKDSR